MKTGLVVFAKNVERLAAFYEACLPLERLETERSHIVSGDDTCELVVHAIPRKVASGISLTRPPSPRVDVAMKPVFEVADIGALREIVVTYGGIMEPIEKAWQIRGSTVLDGLDPEGNVIQFKQKNA